MTINEYLGIPNNEVIKGLSSDSRTIIQGEIFFDLAQDYNKAINNIEEAKSKGAYAIVTDKKIDCNIHTICVSDVRQLLGLCCAQFYSVPDKIVAIVGSCGKTSTMYITQALLSDKYKVGIIGTTGAYIGNKELYYGLTTPDTVDLYKILETMKQAGVDAVIMEVSAQAIHYKKIAGLKFCIGTLTNIAKEHMDFFLDMDNYSKTKLSFFDDYSIDNIVVNIDNQYGVTLAKCKPCITIGLNNPSNVFGSNMMMDSNGSKYIVNFCDDLIYVNTNLIGEYNIYNTLMAISIAKLMGIDNDSIVKHLYNIDMIGRNIKYQYAGSYVVLDFAHTINSIEALFLSYSQIISGKYKVVFGCTWYSDKDKRIEIGKVLDKYCDTIYLTEDNNDSTPVADINRDIMKGINGAKVITIDDRKQCINSAINSLCKDEVLFILGKAGEKFQLKNGQKMYYDEVNYVKSLLDWGKTIESSAN